MITNTMSQKSIDSFARNKTKTGGRGGVWGLWGWAGTFGPWAGERRREACYFY